MLKELCFKHFHEENVGGGDDKELSTIIIRCSLLTKLVENRLCTLYGSSTLAVRVVNCTLGVVYALETHCTSCGPGFEQGMKASNVPFVMVRLLVSASMDMVTVTLSNCADT